MKTIKEKQTPIDVLRTVLPIVTVATLIATTVLLFVQAKAASDDGLYAQLDGSATMLRDALVHEEERTVSGNQDSVYVGSLNGSVFTLDGVEYNLTNSVATSLASPLSFYRFSDVVTTSSDKVTYAIIESDGTLYFREANEFLSAVGLGAFEHVAIISESGNVVAFSGENAPSYINDRTIAIQSVNYDVTKKVLSEGNLTYEFVGLSSQTTISSRILSYSIVSFSAIAISMLLSIGCVGLFYVRKKDKPVAVKQVEDLSVDAAFKSAFRKADIRGKKFVVGIIEVKEFENYRLMFGEAFSVAVREYYLAALREKFGNAYALSRSIGVLFEGDVKVFEADLSDMMQDLNRAVTIMKNFVLIGAYAGFVVVDENNRDYGTACMLARAALQRAKVEGVKQDKSYFVYHNDQRKQYLRYMENICDVDAMIRDGSFFLEYQPQYGIDRKLKGFEALFRMRPSSDLEISTQDFILYAERTGHMIDLGKFIFATGMRFAKSIEGSGVSVSLNVSPVQLMQTGFVSDFLELYRSFELQPGSISIEITETLLMSNFDENIAKLRELARAGIYVHLDDFGTSHSTLLYLKMIPSKSLKIDKAFIDDIEHDEKTRHIVEMIINLAHDLNMEVIAEGVEREAQFSLLKEVQCDVIQGYYFSRSVGTEEAKKLCFKS